jgi:hypothetical protein
MATRLARELGGVRWAFGLASALMIGGCAGEDLLPDEGAGDPEPAEVLRATLGPAGGEIVAGPESSLAGFRLVVPAGALSEEVELEVQSTIDPTPLLPPAFAVGPQIVIRPEGLALAAPISVTVPFDAGLRGAWDAPDEECRVWYREGEGWARAEQTASSPETVTVELDTTTTFGAGVLGSMVDVGCRFDCDAPEPPTATCLDGDRLCIERIATQHVSDVFDWFSLTQGVIYWVSSPTVGQVSLAGFDLRTRAAIPTTAAASLDTTPLPAGDVVVDRAGARWLGFVRRANVRFEGTRLPSVFDTTASTRAIGVALDRASGEAVRFRYQATTADAVVTSARSDGVRTLARAVGTTTLDGVLHPARVTTSPGNYLVWGSAFGTISTSGASCTNCRFPRSVTCPGTFASMRSLAVSPSTNDHAYVCTNTAGGGALLVNSTQRTTFLEGQVPSGRLAIDARRVVYLIEGTRAQITRFNVDGSVTVIPLTSAAVGTAEHTAMRPLGILYENSLDALYVVTQGSGDGRLNDLYEITNLR